MTNEKTIEILKELWRYSKTDKYSESEIREAIENAIKAVEAVDYDCADCKWYLEVKKNEMSTEERKVTDGDLIPRQSVIKMLNKIENAVEDGDGFQFNEWIEYAKDIPSAEKTEEKGENQMKWFRLVYQGEYIIAAENEKEAEELFNSECTELNESEGIEIRYIEELKGEEE